MVRYVFYIYSIKSSITGHLTDRLAIATLSRATSSTAFLSYNPKKRIVNPRTHYPLLLYVLLHHPILCIVSYTILLL